MDHSCWYEWSMSVVVLPSGTPLDEALAACRDGDAGAVVVVLDPAETSGASAAAGSSGPLGDLTAGLAAAGLRVATFAGADDDPALTELISELFGAATPRLNLRQ